MYSEFSQTMGTNNRTMRNLINVTKLIKVRQHIRKSKFFKYLFHFWFLGVFRTLRKKCLYLAFFWSGPENFGPEKLSGPGIWKTPNTATFHTVVNFEDFSHERALFQFRLQFFRVVDLLLRPYIHMFESSVF